MGTILQFRQTGASKRHNTPARSGMSSTGSASAEIIIFPGVRIERQNEPGHPGAKRISGKRTRKAARRKI